MSVIVSFFCYCHVDHHNLLFQLWNEYSTIPNCLYFFKLYERKLNYTLIVADIMRCVLSISNKVMEKTMKKWWHTPMKQIPISILSLQ